MSGAYLLMGYFATTALPLFMNVLFLLDRESYYENMSSDERDVLYVLTVITGIKFFVTWLLIFASCGGHENRALACLGDAIYKITSITSLFITPFAAVISLIIFAA